MMTYLDLKSPQAALAVTLLTLLTLIAAGCGDSTAAAPGVDAGSDANTISCAASWPSKLEGAQGGQASFTLGASARVVGLVVDAPGSWAVDLDQTSGEATLWIPYEASAEQTLTLRFDCDGQPSAHELTVAARPLGWSVAASWESGKDGPTAREHAPLWLAQGDTDTLMMYGGFVFQPKPYTVDDTLWALDLAKGRWREVAAPGRPVAAGLRVAPADGSTEPYLFGGEQAGAPVALQRYFGATRGFEAVKTAAPLAGEVQLGGLVYDADNKRLLSFCGISGGRPHCDVLALQLDGSDPRWEALKVAAPDGRPDGRYGLHWALVAKQRRVVFFAGARSPTATDPVNAASDSWALELEGTPTWRRLTPAGAVPAGRRNGCFAYDAEGQRLLVWGGTADARNAVPGLFALRLRRGKERWDRIELVGAPAVRASCSGIYDGPRRRALFGFGNTMLSRYADLHALAL
jgi:hypothetical protein